MNNKTIEEEKAIWRFTTEWKKRKKNGVVFYTRTETLVLKSLT